MDREITITVTDDEARRIDERVASGEFESAADVVRAALATLDASDADLSVPADELRRLVDEALTDPRPPVPAVVAFARLRSRIQAHADAKSGG